MEVNQMELYVANIPSVPRSKHEDHCWPCRHGYNDLLLLHARSASIPSVPHLQVRNALVSHPLDSLSPNLSFNLFAPSPLPAGFLLAGWMCKCGTLWFLLHYDVRVRGMRTSQLTHTETHLSTDKFGWKSFSWCYRSKYTNIGQIYFSQI